MLMVFADQASTADIIYTLVSHACMLQKGCSSAKIKSVKITLEIYPLCSN